MSKRKSTSRSSKASAKASPTQIIDADLTIEESRGLAPMWVDSVEIIARGEIPIAMLRFFAVVPPRKVEVVRLQTSTQLLKQIVNMLCRNLDYYPTKADLAKPTDS